MRRLWKSVTVAAAAGLWASSALADPIAWTNTTTREIVVLAEDTTCESKLSIPGPPYAFPLNMAATAGCTVFQNSGSAVYNDASTTGPNDFKRPSARLLAASVASFALLTMEPGGS
jgi:hypothetical protein